VSKQYILTLHLPLKRLQYSYMTKKEATEMQQAWERKFGPLRATITEMEDTENVR
jgi:hypothetical protein